LKIENLLKQAKTKGLSYLEDCLSQINMEDMDLKKLIDQVMSKNDNAPNNDVTFDTSIVSANSTLNMSNNLPNINIVIDDLTVNNQREILITSEAEEKAE
jgi:hypothetical protein